MKAMIWKELRECGTWAVLAMVLVGVGQIFAYNIDNITKDPLQFWDAKVAFSVLCAAVAGGTMGAVQILPELKPDQWAFLLHRPVSASRIFAGKTIAGMLMLALVVFIPDILLFSWLRFHLGFEIVSFRYLLDSFYIGFSVSCIFYFSAIVAALRPARIFGSRLLSVVTAIAVTTVLVLAEQWQSMLLIALCLVILVKAAQGCFAARGEYRRMVGSAKVALGLTLLTGGVAVALGVAFFTGSLIPEYFGRAAYYEEVPLVENSLESKVHDSFIADRMGRVLRTNFRYQNNTNKKSGHDALLIVETVPEGKPELIPFAEWPRKNFASMQLLRSNGEPLVENRSAIATRTKYFVEGSLTKISEDKNTLVYYDEVAHRIVFFSLKTRRIVGYSGPGGYYDVDVMVPTEQAYFPGELLSRPSDHFFWFDREVFRIDQSGRAVKLIIQAQPGETIQSIVAIEAGNTHQLWVVTGGAIEQYDTEGKRLYTTTLDPEEQQSQYIGVVSVMSGKYLFWFANIHKNWQGEPSLYSTVLETTNTGKVLRRFGLPALSMDGENYISPPIFLTGIALPVLRYDEKVLEKTDASAAEIFEYSYVTSNTRIPILFTILSALFSAALTWLIARRAGLTLLVRLLWVIAALPLGLGAVITLLALYAWPVRFVCKQCGKKRNVEKESCNHCKAPWPRPERNGTEILTREFEARALVAGGQQ